MIGGINHRVWLVAAFIALAARPAGAGSLTLAWNANIEPDIAGYVLAYGTQPNSHSTRVDVGNRVTWQLPNLVEGQRYYFVVSAYNTGGRVSLMSNEVSGVVPSTCTSRVSPASLSVNAMGGATTFIVSAGAGCPWMAATSVPWLTVTSGASGAGNGSFTVMVAPKRAPDSRTADVHISSAAPGAVPILQSGGTGKAFDRLRWDADGDSKTDVAVWRPGTGTWYVRLSGAGGATAARNWGGGWMDDRPVPGDYDGDGIGDYAVWRPASGMWYVLTSSSGFVSDLSIQWGGGPAGDVPVPADYDGDGKTDIAVWRPSTAVWYVKTSGSGFVDSMTVQWGGAGDQPVVGDYDGDGRADVAVWRGSTGVWYILRSSLNYSQTHPIVMHWGGAWAGDKPVLADYDGDGATDLAVWRGPTGSWYLLLSGGGYSQAGARSVQWGGATAGDQPVVGDYDGDGKTDIAVWRGPTGMWYIKTSSTDFADSVAVQWGSSTVQDVPVPR
jgi:hypothetical protein